MKNRLTIALVALLLFALVVIIPVSATKTGGNNYYYNVSPNINLGATVFLGEQNLNLAPSGITDGTVLGWWAAAASINASSPSRTVIITSAKAYSVTASDYGMTGSTSNWYVVSGGTLAPGTFAFQVVDPTLDVAIRAPDIGADVTGQSVTRGTNLQFEVKTNQYSALDATKRGPVYNNSAGDGYIDIKVKTDSGAVLNQLYTTVNGSSTAGLTSINVYTQPYYWGVNGLLNSTANASIFMGTPFSWNTGATIGGQQQYAPGTYTVWAESLLNNMKENYKDASGASYMGKTVSPVKTVSLVSDTLKITINKDTIVRGKAFSVSITGRPSDYYCLWVSGVSGLDSTLDDQPPLISTFQTGIDTGNGLCANYTPQNRPGTTISSDASHNNPPAGNDLLRWAQVSTSSSGSRTVGFTTDNNTKAQKYTIRVESNSTGRYVSDQVDVKIEKGAVNIVAAGDQSYYLGEEIKLSGTNTESYTTYMFIIGPNLATDGAQLDNPRTAVPNDGSGMVSADVQSDNTWSYKWGTSSLALDAGTYTIYAVSQPVDRSKLSTATYGTVSVIIKKPFVSATASQSTVAKGDKVYITGTAEGQPSSGVAIWIMGKNYAFRSTASVASDASFKYEVTSSDTSSLYSGQYFVVVQHPMQNGKFDIDTNPGWSSGQIAGNQNVFVVNYQLGSVNATSGMTIFKINGAGSLQGSDAAEALVQAINDPNVDDTYTKLQFVVQEGIINIAPLGNKHVADKFNITATTNLAVDDEILVQVYSSSFKPTQKSQSGEFSGATGTVKVIKGDSGMNTITFPVDASTFKPDEYIVTEEAVIQGTTGTALFNVIEGVATPVVTTPVPTIATPVPTPVVPATRPTVNATPIPTPTKSPGYGAVLALIGLGAVAFIVVRRH
jgi:PGF-CTERM protein